MSAALGVHVAGGGVALLAGFAALLARKGSPLHRYVGYAFVGGMLVMAAGAMVVGVERGQYGNVLAAAFVVYLVATAVITLLPSSPGVARLNAALRVVALPLGLAFVAVGVYRLTSAAGGQGGVPARSIAVASFLNAAVTLLGWWGDVRVARRGALRGAARVRRHLWRMCYATFVASGSFFLGQARVLPPPLRIRPVLAGLAALPLLVMLYYLWRYRGRRRSVAAVPASNVAALLLAVCGLAPPAAPHPPRRSSDARWASTSGRGQDRSPARPAPRPPVRASPSTA